MINDSRLNLCVSANTKRQAEIAAELENTSVNQSVSRAIATYSLIKTEVAKGSTISIIKADGTVAELVFI